MIHSVRKCLPDELWWSWMARNMDTVGLNTPGTNHSLLVGNKRSIGSALLPRQIAATISSLDATLTIDEVIDLHTLLPLYAAFVDTVKTAKARTIMAGNGNLEFALGIAAGGDYDLSLRGCSACIERDRNKHGTAFWRTSLQAPGTLVCPEDKHPLMRSDVSARVASQVPLFVTIDKASFTQPTKISPRCIGDAIWIAKANQSIIAKRPANPGGARLTSLYRIHLEKRGFIDKFGRLAFGELMAAFLGRMTRVLQLVECDIPDRNVRDNWVARLARYPRSEQSPLKHILLMRFLNLAPLAALAEAASLPPYLAPVSLCPPSARRSTRITEERVQQYRARWLQLRSAHSVGSLRQKADRLYSWLWRNDRAWLHYYARSASKTDTN
jgi:hypothetical protein